MRVSRGVVSLETGCNLLHTAYTAPGSSGAPILDLATGTVIGVHLASNCIVLPDRPDIPMNGGAVVARVHAALRRVGYAAAP